MFVCSECHELFHPECVGLLLEDLRRRAELRDDHFTCEEHSPSVVERRMSLRRERSATTCSLSSHGRREDTADEALGGGGACEESAPLSKAAPSSAPEDRGQPSSWPKGAGCRYRNWLVWGDPGSEAEKLRSRCGDLGPPLPLLFELASPSDASVELRPSPFFSPVPSCPRRPAKLRLDRL